MDAPRFEEFPTTEINKEPTPLTAEFITNPHAVQVGVLAAALELLGNTQVRQVFKSQGFNSPDIIASHINHIAGGLYELFQRGLGSDNTLAMGERARRGHLLAMQAIDTHPAVANAAPKRNLFRRKPIQEEPVEPQQTTFSYGPLLKGAGAVIIDKIMMAQQVYDDSAWNIDTQSLLASQMADAVNQVIVGPVVREANKNTGLQHNEYKLDTIDGIFTLKRAAENAEQNYFNFEDISSEEIGWLQDMLLGPIDQRGKGALTDLRPLVVEALGLITNPNVRSTIANVAEIQWNNNLYNTLIDRHIARNQTELPAEPQTTPLVDSDTVASIPLLLEPVEITELPPIAQAAADAIEEKTGEHLQLAPKLYSTGGPYRLTS